MADVNPPIVGNAAAFERSAKAILARAEAALRASVATVTEVKVLADQIEAAATASQGEDAAAAAINRKADAAERAAAAVARQNAEMRSGAGEVAQQDRAAAAMERRAVAAERLAASTVAVNAAAARGQGALFDESAGRQDRLFAPARGPVASQAAESEARALHAVNAEARAAAEAEGRLAVMGNEAAVSQNRLAAAQREAARTSLAARGGIAGMARGYAEFLAITIGIGAGIDLFHNVVEGAKESQQGVQDLKRVLHEVDPREATRGFRELSQEFNVPIKDVAESQFGFARVTQDQGEALEATRAGLAATKLDAIGAADSVRYLTVAMQAFHLSGTQMSETGGVFDQLENVSRRLGVPVGQIMQSFRALPAVANSQGDLTQFIGISAAMARASGRTGTEINTTIARAATNFVPRNAQALRGFGLDPGGSITQLIIDATQKAQHLNRAQRTELANLIAGPLRGGTLLGLFDRPDVLKRSLAEASPGKAAGATEDEMKQVMGRIDTQIGEVGKHLSGLGESLAQSGVLNGLGIFASLLTSITDKLRTVVELFNAIPGHDKLAPVLELAGGVALARRAGVGERLGGPLSFLAAPLTSPMRAGRESLKAERDMIQRELVSTRSRATSAALNMRLAAGAGDEAAAIAARERLTALQQREAVLVAEQAALANRTAQEQVALNAARERELVALGIGTGVVAAEVGAATASGAATAAGMGGTKGVIAGGGLLGVAGGAGKFLKGLGAIGVYFAAFQQLQGMMETRGNLGERIAGGGRSVLGMVGIHTGPITNEENRKAGAKDAHEYVRGLAGGLDFNASNTAQMNQRRALITQRINRLDAQEGGNKFRVAEEMRRLQAELVKETALEHAMAAARAARRGGRVGIQDLSGLTSQELAGVQSEALLPMQTVGDDRGLTTAVAVADTLSSLGHKLKRADLLKKADDAIKNNIQAIQGELQDNLALATSQRDRDKAYADALAQADKLRHSHSPAQRRAGELLERQTVIQQLQDDAKAASTETGISGATHPGDIVGNAQRAARDARANYHRTRDRLGADAPETREALKAYQEARNAANAARIQRIERDGGLEEAQQRTAIGKDNVRVATLQRALAAARAAPHPNTDTIVQLETQLADAKAQQAQQTANDANAATDAYYQYLEAQTDDPLQQALLEQRRVAGQKLDPTDPNAAAKQRTLNAQQAQRTRQAAHQDAQDRIAGRFDRADALADPGDTAAAADRAYRRARDLRRNAPGLTQAERTRQDNDVLRTREERMRAHQQSAYDDITHNANIGKLTTDMEVNALRRLKNTIHGNRALKRQIEEQIYSLTHQNEGSLELQLGNIRLPTPYEVNRAIRESGGGRRASARGMAVHNSVQVNVTGDTDLGKMADAIDSVVGTSTRSALRASGVL